jgi:hypothetical protein
LDAEIARAETHLAELELLREKAAARLTELHRRRAGRSTEGVGEGDERSPASKVRLFRDLFVGRRDAFAVRWENRAHSRSGYAPRCANEWRQGVCEKPKVRCGSCSSQAFVALGEHELLAHLQGRQVVGIYPAASGRQLSSVGDRS